jgi:hypothetical protein
MSTALSKEELIGSLQNEVRILLHLATKVDRSKLDYRPTAKQRSTLELLQYLTVMGPALVGAVKAGAFDGPGFQKAMEQAGARNFDQTVAALEAQSTQYPQMLGEMTDEDLRGEINLFGHPGSRGSVLVNLVLSGCAAYRTQLFLYLKSCGREELSTYDLWAGMDAPAASA